MGSTETRALRGAPIIPTLTIDLFGARKSRESRDLGGRRLGKIENRAFRRAPMILSPTVGPLGLGSPGRAETLEEDVWGVLKMEHSVVRP